MGFRRFVHHEGVGSLLGLVVLVLGLVAGVSLTQMNTDFRELAAPLESEASDPCSSPAGGVMACRVQVVFDSSVTQATLGDTEIVVAGMLIEAGLHPGDFQVLFPAEGVVALVTTAPGGEEAMGDLLLQRYPTQVRAVNRITVPAGLGE